MIKRLLPIVTILLSVARCGGDTPTSPTSAPATIDGVLVGAGDIALCSALAPAEATATLLDTIEGSVFTAGDNVQAVGADEEFRNCFDPTWGRHRDRTHPAPGNHDYMAAGAAPYYAYFGSAAGTPDVGYYSYNIATWHVVVLNNYVDIGSGSLQLAWLARDLERSTAPCTIAYWHEPLFSSAQNGPNPGMTDLWRVLHTHGVDVVMNGHDHVYERFAPQDPDGHADPLRGIRQFIVGTGGAPLYGFVRVSANSEIRARAHGVLKLTLRTGMYNWEFVPVAGETFRDFGSGACH